MCHAAVWLWPHAQLQFVIPIGIERAIKRYSRYVMPIKSQAALSVFYNNLDSSPILSVPLYQRPNIQYVVIIVKRPKEIVRAAISDLQVIPPGFTYTCWRISLVVQLCRF